MQKGPEVWLLHYLLRQKGEHHGADLGETFCVPALFPPHSLPENCLKRWRCQWTVLTMSYLPGCFSADGELWGEK